MVGILTQEESDPGRKDFCARDAAAERGERSEKAFPSRDELGLSPAAQHRREGMGGGGRRRCGGPGSGGTEAFLFPRPKAQPRGRFIPKQDLLKRPGPIGSPFWA